MSARVIFFGLLALLALVSCEPDERVPSYEDTPMGNFEALWHTIDTKYCFLTSKGVDWGAIGEEYRTRLEGLGSSVSDRELFDLMESMLDSLADGHVNLYSDFDISRSSIWYENYPMNYDQSIVYGANYLGADYQIAGGFHYGLVGDGVAGYMRYGSFSSGFSAANMYYMLDYFRECKGLIIDVRHNGGGSLSYSEKLLSYLFLDEEVTVGYIQHKDGTGHDDFSEMKELRIEPDGRIFWGRPVIVLCNRRSYSATNHFVSSARVAPQVLVMGSKTGGGSGMPLSHELPNGWLLRFSAVPMYDLQKNCIEDGVMPDVEVTMDSVSQAAGRDAVIDAAIKVLREFKM